MEFIYSFTIIDQDQINWELIESTYDQTIYKTESWYRFLLSSHNIKPYIISIKRNNELIGFFIGERLKKIVWIVASPFEGLTTSYQGLSLLIEISSKERIEIYKNISTWLFQNNQCYFFQVSDWQLDIDSNLYNSNLRFTKIEGYKLDLSKTVDELFKNLHQKSCRYSINKSIKNGVVIRQTLDPIDFVNNYYDQLLEVFSKQGLKPTYGIERVQSLVNSLYSDGKLLLLEAVTSENEIIATGLFPASKNIAIYWGGASRTKFQHLCPNEPMIWEAIKFWKSKDVTTFEFGGGRSYKKKFGTEHFYKPRIEIAKYDFIITLKELAKKAYYLSRSFKSLFKFK